MIPEVPVLLQFLSSFLVLLLGTGMEVGGRNAPARADSKGNVSHFGVPPEPPAAEIQVGDPAPNFSYQGFDGRWLRLQNLLEQGPVLLVFAPSLAELRRLEEARDGLLDLGVVPVAFMDLKPGAARGLAKRMGLRYTVLSDQRLVVASQFNAVQNAVLIPAWFVIDPRGKVRGLWRGKLPDSDYPQLCANALSLPLPGSTVPSLGGNGPMRRIRL
jgi:peroxiredoxin